MPCWRHIGRCRKLHCRSALKGAVLRFCSPSLSHAVYKGPTRRLEGTRATTLLRPQPNARCVAHPEPAALGLLTGNLQPLTLPDTLDPLSLIVQPAWRSSAATLR
jgi:hypothetical protein